VARSIAKLEQAKRELGKPITIHVVPGANHGLRDSRSGAPANFWPVVMGWLDEQASR
jgi:hypothetical protein